MPLVIRDRVKETTTTAGTGTITLAGAASGFQSFSAIGDGNSTYYVITDPATGDWEVGIGTYTSSGTTLSRTTVLSSSNSGSLVTFAAGVKDVFVSYPSSRAVYQNEAGTQTVQSAFGAITATSAALTTGTITTAPSGGTDIVNKSYVDTLAASGIHFHQPVRVESPINLNATYNNGTAGVGATLTNAGTQAALVIDGITMVAADRVLVYEQTNETQNGIYVVTDIGSGSTNWILTRASDADTYVINSADGLSEGSTVFVQQGTTGAGETYTCNTSGVITFGTTNITFAQISSTQIYSAGTGLTLSGTQFSITNTGTAGTYGSASSVPVFTTNAQGQVTGVTPTAIAINGSAVTGNITGQAGSVANALTAGTFLTSGGTYDGSAARTFAVDATDANTASKVVARDASGNFSAGTITAALSGNATSATNVAGGAANRIVFNTGSAATSFVVAPTTSGEVLGWNGSAFAWATSIASATNVTGTVAVANGGTGRTSLTANNVLLGNGTTAVQQVAPGTSGNVLTSNGTTWTSAAAGAALSGVTDSGSPFETALGSGAGAVNTGANNTFIGFEAGNGNTTGAENTAVGFRALDVNTTGSTNVAIGFSALGEATTATSNTAVGHSSLLVSNASENTAVGHWSLYSNTSGNRNVAFGVSAGRSVTTGTQNTIIGGQAGYPGLPNLTTGSNNTLLGYNAAASSATVSNEVTIGNSNITSFRVPGISLTWTSSGLPVANGGTGRATLTANNVILGNGTTAVQQVAPGTSGNVLTSNGTTWTSGTVSAGMKLLATLNINNGDTTVAATGLPVCNQFVAISYASQTNSLSLDFDLSINNGSSYDTNILQWTTSTTTPRGVLNIYNAGVSDTKTSLALFGDLASGTVRLSTFGPTGVINAIRFKVRAGTFTGGKIYLYGIN
jgi:hypothetical protein